MKNDLRVVLTTCPGAPRSPGSATLVRLFRRAWSATPARNRPEVPTGLVLSVELRWVTDEEITDLHARHFGQRKATDVVSFPMLDVDPEDHSFLLGAIAVSFETARREAAARALPYAEELERYALHGFLHLIGYRDKVDRDRRAMTAQQERILSAHRC